MLYPSPSLAARMTHPVARELRKIAGVRFFQRFYDWLELSLAAFCRDEERYMETMRRYGPLVPGKNHPADHFAAALGAVHLAMAKDNEAGVIHDHLGEIYETEGASEKEMAQFFTPMPLCQLMARMTIDETTPEDAVISDPACGSGRFFLAAIPLRPNAHFIGVDVDRTCAKMAVLNMLWRNANATIIWGQHLAADGQRRLGNEPHCSGRRGHQFWGGACPSCAGGAIQEERRPTG